MIRAKVFTLQQSGLVPRKEAQTWRIKVGEVLLTIGSSPSTTKENGPSSGIAWGRRLPNDGHLFQIHEQLTTRPIGSIKLKFS